MLSVTQECEMPRVYQFERIRIMKSFITVAIASLIAAAAIGATNAEAKSFWKYNVQFMKDGMKFYSKTCTDDKQQCGNWNVKG